MILLSQKKKLETFLERITSQKYALEDQLLTLEEMETHGAIYDSLCLAEKAGKTMQKDLENYEELFERIDTQKTAQEQLNSFIADRARIEVEEDSVLLEELEQLEVGQVEQ